MKYLGNAFLHTFIIGIISFIAVSHYENYFFWQDLLALIYFSPLILLGIWTFLLAYFLIRKEKKNRHKPLFIAYGIILLGLFAVPIYNLFGINTPPKEVRSYYYFRHLDATNKQFFEEPKYITSEVDYVDKYHSLNAEEKIDLPYTELIEYGVFSNDYKIYFNQKNELIFVDNQGSLYIKLDINGNEKEKVRYHDGTNVWSNIKIYSYIVGDKIVDATDLTYCDWLEAGDMTQKKVVEINANFHFSKDEEEKILKNIIADRDFLWINKHKTELKENSSEQETEYFKVFYTENDKVFLFYTTFDLRYGQYKQENNSYYDKPDLESRKLLERFFAKKGKKVNIFSKEDLPFSGFFSKRKYIGEGLWEGVSYFKIPLERDTLLAAMDSKYFTSIKIKGIHYFYKNEVEEIETFESFDNVSLYKNKNLNYKLLKVGDFFFVVKKNISTEKKIK